MWTALCLLAVFAHEQICTGSSWQLQLQLLLTAVLSEQHGGAATNLNEERGHT